jgi:N-acyl-D-amino-acid deacylase
VSFDVILRNGLVFDGSGTAPRGADVGIARDRITVIDDLTGASAPLEIDANGLAVAPGFIDAHTHSDLSSFLAPCDRDVQAATVLQGVTTEIAGNCGFSTFPTLPEHLPDLKRHIGALLGEVPIDWTDLAGFRDAVSAQGVYSNLAPLVGHGSIRVGTMGFDPRPPTEDQLRTMGRLLEEAFEQGAFGFTSGLVYIPGIFADADELRALASTIARHGRPYATHVRGETHAVGTAVREAIGIARDAGLPLQLSHHKAAGRENWGRTEETLQIVEEARRSGADVTLDVYPYTAASTIVDSLLPPWAREGGLFPMLERLRDRVSRDQMTGDFETGLSDWENMQRAAGWDGIVLASVPGRPSVEGRSIGELARDAKRHPAEFLYDLIVEEEARATIIMHVMSEADVERVMTYEAAMIGSDGIPLPGKPHPRWAGSFARVLGRYTREKRLFDLATAIRKMTVIPAERFGIKDRGRLEVGKLADVVVFDPGLVADGATFEQPLRGPVGVRHVFVNGTAAVRDGALTGAKAGSVLSC